MEVTSSTDIRDDLQAIANTENSDDATDNGDTGQVESAEDEFAKFMRQALGGAAKTEVNEEELFAALIDQRLEQEDPEAAAFYREAKARLMVSMARGDGYVPVEDVAAAALRETVAEGKIDEDTAALINGQAFAAAQLDDNHDALYDSHGSAEDPTVAVSTMEAALLEMRTKMAQIESGELEVAARPLDTPSNNPLGDSSSADGASGAGGSAPSGAQQPMDGSGGFLWKPISEGDGNLVVLLPTTLKGLIDRVEIHTQIPPDDTTRIAEGRFAGDDHNGGRPHFRFDKPGADYGSDIHVVVFKDDGSTVTYSIGNGAERHD